MQFGMQTCMQHHRAAQHRQQPADRRGPTAAGDMPGEHEHAQPRRDQADQPDQVVREDVIARGDRDRDEQGRLQVQGREEPERGPFGILKLLATERRLALQQAGLVPVHDPERLRWVTIGGDVGAEGEDERPRREDGGNRVKHNRAANIRQIAGRAPRAVISDVRKLSHESSPSRTEKPTDTAIRRVGPMLRPRRTRPRRTRTPLSHPAIPSRTTPIGGSQARMATQVVFRPDDRRNFNNRIDRFRFRPARPRFGLDSNRPATDDSLGISRKYSCAYDLDNCLADPLARLDRARATTATRYNGREAHSTRPG